MRSLKILVVANNCEWQSWPEKIAALESFFSRRIRISFDIAHTQFKEIPMMDMVSERKIYRGVEAGWYDAHVSPLGKDYDIVLFVMNLKQWGSAYGARGWRSDASFGPIELQVSADEYELVDYPQFGRLPAFFQFARHEIMHALYLLNLDQGKGDRTHYFWDLGRFDEALDDIDIGNNRIVTGDIWGFVSRFFEYLKGGGIEKWAKAIQEFEGFGPGTKSRRNNNPGNLKYTGYTASLGAVGADNTGFAIFPSYEAGFDALKRFLSDAKGDKLISYRSNMTLRQFFSVYAPSSDHNDPDTYAAFVAKRIGVPDSTPIKSI